MSSHDLGSGKTPNEKKADDKTIFVDEDWKSQVQAEKQAAAEAADQSPPQPEDSSTGGDVEPPGSAQRAADSPTAEQMPPASLGMLVSGLATQAMMALGSLPMPDHAEPAVDLGQAKHLIDLLGVLESKTVGNRTSDEDALLQNVLHELRMAFVSVRDRTAGGKPSP